MNGGNVNYDLVRERLKEVITDLGMNPNSFAKMVKIDSSNFLKKFKGLQGFTPKDFEKLAKANVNVDWLLTGEGDMYTGKINKITLPVNPEKAVPVYGEEFSCGFLSFNDSALQPIGYVDFPGTRGATCWCKATGDSMMPMITNGDYVCLKKLADWKDFIVFGDVYAIDTYNDMRSIKRIERGATDDEFTLVPANKEYSSQSIRKDLIRGLFRVLAVTKIL